MFLLALLPTLAIAQAAQETAPAPAADAKAADHAMVHAAQIQWGDAPPFLPKGAQMTVLSGDPGKAGPFAIRLKAPAGYKVPRHWHPSAEQVTIIEGDFTLSMGDAATSHGGDFAPGDYVNLPAQMQHEASTKNGVVVQINSTGPFEITYVDPKDDPRKAMPAAPAKTN
jgi:anti-sigma factor ChrR (cupin superfamily)